MNKLFFLPLLFLMSCSPKEAPVSQVTINGHIRGASADTLYLSVLEFDNITDTDTLITDAQGKFTHVVEPQGAQFFLLLHKGGNFTRLLFENGEEVQLTADLSNIGATCAAVGSPGTALLLKIEKALALATKKVDSLMAVAESHKGKPSFDKVFPELDSLYKSNFNSFRDEMKAQIENNYTSLASVVAIMQSLGGQNVFAEFEDADLFSRLSDSIMAHHPTNSFAIHLQNRVVEMKLRERQKKQLEERIQLGNVAPDITIPDRQGKMQRISDLKGKTVLLKFWDSHCSTCKQENKVLASIYASYKNKGFEIFSVSVDTERSDWLSYLSKNNYPWLHVWLYDEPADAVSTIANGYFTDIIPVAHLIGADGRIIRSNIRSEDIESELKKIYP